MIQNWKKKLELAIFWTLDSVNGVSISGHSLPNLLNGRLRFEVMASKRQSVKISHFYKNQPLMRLPKRMDNFITKQRKMHFQNLSTEWTYNIKIIFHVPKKYEWLISIILAKSKEMNEFVLVVISVVNITWCFLHLDQFMQSMQHSTPASYGLCILSHTVTKFK